MAEKVVELVYAENDLPASGTCRKFILVTDQGRGRLHLPRLN